MDRRRFLVGGGVLGLSATGIAPAAPAPRLADASARLRGLAETYEKTSGGHVGVYAHDVSTGRVLAWRAHERFVMCSTFKLSLVALTLLRVDRGAEQLDKIVPYGSADIGTSYAPVAHANLTRGGMTVRDMCAAIIEWSDNACANLIMRRAGGPEAVTRFWRNLGDRVSRLEDWEPLLNRTPRGGLRNTTTPASMAFIVQRTVFGKALSEASRVLLVGWLEKCQTGAQRLRAGVPAGWVVGDKTGNNGRDAAGDIAFMWRKPTSPVVVCVYTRGGIADERQFHDVFSGVGRIVSETF